jgi:mannose-6-phosphate isomerase-like protein (cupin superfamily)
MTPGNATRRKSMTDTHELRRIVTTIDETGTAIVLFDGENPRKEVRPVRGNVTRLVWKTDQAPADMSGRQDRAAVEIGTSPPAGGTIFRIIDYPPATPESEQLDTGHRLAQLAHEAPIKGRPPRHPFMHRTRSLDYVIILSGEIDMLLDETEIHLKAGDVLVQQGTNHAWVNRGKEVCRIAFVLVDAQAPA